eukprot:2375523-Pyramimonas_sp.AAC.1
MRTGDQDFATATSDTPVALGPARDQRILEESVRVGRLVPKRVPPQHVEARDHPLFAGVAKIWQKWSEAEAEAGGNGGPITPLISSVPQYQDRLIDELWDIDPTMADSSPTELFGQLFVGQQ